MSTEDETLAALMVFLSVYFILEVILGDILRKWWRGTRVHDWMVKILLIEIVPRKNK